MTTYAEDRVWSDQFIPEIKRIVGPYLLMESPFEIDTKQAADLIVMRAKDMMIAARVRRPGYAEKYPNDFTIRSKRDNGKETELPKLISGYGDWFFYGHASGETGKLSRWFLIDLHIWRKKLIEAGYVNGWHRYAKEKPNGDGTHFLAFDINKMPGICIARYPLEAT